MKTRILVTMLMLTFVYEAKATYPVYDPVNHATAQASYVQDTIHNAKEIAEMIKQYQQMVREFQLQAEQFNVQKIIRDTENEIKSYKGDPKKLKGFLNLDLFEELVTVKDHGVIMHDSYKVTNDEKTLYKEIDHTTGEVKAPTDRFKEHKVTEKTYQEYEKTVKNVKPQLEKLEKELSTQLAISKSASTEVEIQRASVAVAGLQAKIDVLLYKERLANNQLKALESRNTNKQNEENEARRKRIELAKKRFYENSEDPGEYRFGRSNEDDDDDFGDFDF